MARTALSPQRGNNAATVRILIAALVVGTLLVGTLAIVLVRRNAVRDHDGEELRTSQLAVQAMTAVAVQ